MAVSAFKKFEHEAWPYVFGATMHVDKMAGGTPSDPDVAKRWIEQNLGVVTEDELKDLVAEIMVDRGYDPSQVTDDQMESVVSEANMRRHLNGFRKNEKGMYVGGYQIKAAIREAVNICVTVGKLSARFGTTKKGALGFISEHVMVVEDEVYFDAPITIEQRFVHASGRTGPIHSIQYSEVARDVELNFTVETDYGFTEKEWAMLWLTAEREGLGATRSQGYGRYTVTRWEPLRAPKPKAKADANGHAEVEVEALA